MVGSVGCHETSLTISSWCFSLDTISPLMTSARAPHPHTLSHILHETSRSHHGASASSSSASCPGVRICSLALAFGPLDTISTPNGVCACTLTLHILFRSMPHAFTTQKLHTFNVVANSVCTWTPPHTFTLVAYYNTMYDPELEHNLTNGNTCTSIPLLKFAHSVSVHFCSQPHICTAEHICTAHNSCITRDSASYRLTTWCSLNHLSLSSLQLSRPIRTWRLGYHNTLWYRRAAYTM